MRYGFSEVNGHAKLTMDVPGHDNKDITVKLVNGKRLDVTVGGDSYSFRLAAGTKVTEAKVEKGRLFISLKPADDDIVTITVN